MDVPEKFHQQLVTFMLLIHEKITKQMENVHKDVLTTSQFLMVASLMNYGSMTMSALAGRINVQKQQATKIANQLVDMDFMCRIPDQKDRRIIRVDLTKAAQDFMYSYFMDSMQNASRHFGTLEEQEFMELQAAIEVMIRILPHINISTSKKPSDAASGSN